MSKTNGKTREVLRSAASAAQSSTAVASTSDAAALKHQIDGALKEALQSKQLTRTEAAEVRTALSHDINTGFGTRNEDAALQAYEQLRRLRVFGKNDRFLIWPFPRDPAPDVDATQAPAELAQGWTVELESGRQAVKQERAELQAAVGELLQRTAVAAALGAVVEAVAPAAAGGSSCEGELCAAVSCADCDEGVNSNAAAAAATAAAATATAGDGAHSSTASTDCPDSKASTASSDSSSASNSCTSSSSSSSSTHAAAATRTDTTADAKADTTADTTAGTTANANSVSDAPLTELLTPVDIAAGLRVARVHPAHSPAGATLLAFPPTLAPWQRQLVHACAEAAGLLHESVGEGQARRLVISSCSVAQLQLPAGVDLDAATADALLRTAAVHGPSSSSSSRKSSGSSNSAASNGGNSISNRSSSSSNSGSSSSAASSGSGSVRRRSSSSSSNYDDYNDDDCDGRPQSKQRRRGSSVVRTGIDSPHFSVVGFVDGVAEELYQCPLQDDPENFAVRRVVVEVSATVCICCTYASATRTVRRDLLLRGRSHSVHANNALQPRHAASVTAACVQPVFSCQACGGAIAKEKLTARLEQQHAQCQHSYFLSLNHIYIYFFQVKNRMRRFQQPPSLADQIQLVCYCLMLGTSDGDLVQALRGRRGEVYTPIHAS
jgi:R3H domain